MVDSNRYKKILTNEEALKIRSSSKKQQAPKTVVKKKQELNNFLINSRKCRYSEYWYINIAGINNFSKNI